MVSDPNRFVRLNLIRDYCTSLSLVTFLPKAEPTFKQFENLLDQDGYFLSASKYRRGSTDHLIWITLDGDSEPADQLYIRIEFDVPSGVPPGPPPKSMQHEAEIVERLNQLTEPLQWHCRVDFEYDDENLPGAQTVFPLPIPFESSLERLPFDEIRGIRGVKRSESDLMRNEYTFTLDRSETTGVILNLDFYLSQLPSVSTPASVFAIARAIAKRLVFVGPRR